MHFQNLAYCSASPIGKERSKENESARIPEEKTPGLTARYMSQLLLLGKIDYGGGPIFKVVLEF